MARRLVWFVAIWAISVAAVGGVGFALGRLIPH
jgi:hypothetical protein